MAKPLAELDLPDRLSGTLPVWASQLLVAVACTAIAFATRELVDKVLPAAGPFALTFPFVLAATLFARWLAGAYTQVFCSLFAWYFVLPYEGSFEFAVASDGPRVVVNMLSGFLLVALAEIFRRAVRFAVDAREEETEMRELYLREFDHRVKNNFQIIASMLELQKRQLPEGAAADAIAEAQSRVSSIAQAHQSLYRGDGKPQTVEMEIYLQDLCSSLREGMLVDRDITLECRAAPASLDRDQAVSVGLLANELVTNALKHAFPDGRSGTIFVGFENSGERMRLTVADNGVGMSDTAPSSTSLGQRLIAAFARQAGGELRRDEANPGTRFVITLDHMAAN